MKTLRELLHTDAVAGLDPDAPVVMLNLMKFRERSLDGQGSGWDAYSRYSAHTVPLLKARGGTIIWAGSVRAVALGSIADGDCDYAVLVPAAGGVPRHDDLARVRRRESRSRERDRATPHPRYAHGLLEARAPNARDNGEGTPVIWVGFLDGPEFRMGSEEGWREIGASTASSSRRRFLFSAIHWRASSTTRIIPGSELRELIVGHCTRRRVLVVCFIQRGDRIRTFSARRATRQERPDHEEGTS